MKEPWFWRGEGPGARAAAAMLTPLAAAYDGGQRLKSAGARARPAGVPVICIGNATLGGAGKTPFAIMLHRLLKDRGVEAHFLTRGHGGALKGTAEVLPHHGARAVGDEALLLAARARTWVSRDRPAGAAAAVRAGAPAIIMDDGFQNPSIAKDFSILLIEARDPFGNGRVFPAGPMREPLARALDRADAIAYVGAAPRPGIATKGRPIFQAQPKMAISAAPGRIIAFCGIARPQRFFDGLAAAGFDLAEAAVFADHHFYGEKEIARLKAKAARAGAALATTEKDIVRLAPEARAGILVASLEMSVDDPKKLTELALAAMNRAE